MQVVGGFEVCAAFVVCPLCGARDGSVQHLLCDCPCSVTAWNDIAALPGAPLRLERDAVILWLFQCGPAEEVRIHHIRYVGQLCSKALLHLDRDLEL